MWKKTSGMTAHASSVCIAMSRLSTTLRTWKVIARTHLQTQRT
jgi:hypothetical protein